ncbi:hypothetical protein LIER_18565 [Lithospermum erythrorhizon]|uniref:ATP-dependent DNA helicase n=1 Tax=Lithospermum erythrorhizon TaxID=34254 RepID=A0AAV3QEL7_LITER
MCVGNGDELTNDAGQIKLPSPMVVPYITHSESLESLISYVYPELSLFATDPFTMMKRAILALKNDFFDDITLNVDRTSGCNVEVLILPNTCTDEGTLYTTNVIHREVLAHGRAD